MNRKTGDLEYILTRKNVKNINLRIRPDGSVYVSAPYHVPTEKIDDFVLSKLDFIAKARGKLNSDTAEVKQNREYISGDKFTLLGREITLEIAAGDTGTYLDGSILRVCLINTHSYALRKKAVNSFFDARCKTLFTSLTDKYYPQFKKYGIRYPTLKIKDMKSRWGSCIPSKGIITLNRQLIAAPEECVEYVVVHEYCHFLEANHSEKFYAHVERYLPDWRERRSRLNGGAYSI